MSAPVDHLNERQRRALNCPTWCRLDAAHGFSDNEIREAGVISRDHLGEKVTVVDGSHMSPDVPVTVHLRKYVDFCDEDGLQVEPATVHVEGLPFDGLTLDEAALLAHQISLLVMVGTSEVTR